MKKRGLGGLRFLFEWERLEHLVRLEPTIVLPATKNEAEESDEEDSDEPSADDGTLVHAHHLRGLFLLSMIARLCSSVNPVG